MSACKMDLDELIVKLYEIKAVKFGEFKLKSGITSPVYFDLRVIVSYPNILAVVSDLLWKATRDYQCDVVCGVPYTALPLATCISVKQNIPMIVRRKEAKDYGTKKMIEGLYHQGDKCLIIDDVATSGLSITETADLFRKEGIVVEDAIVLLDREQGAVDRLDTIGIRLHSVLTMSYVLQVLQKTGKLSTATVDLVKEFINENKFKATLPTQPKTVDNKQKTMSYLERAELCDNGLTKKIFHIMNEKKTNLCLSVDVTKTSQLLELADKVGPYICVLKTHIDILDDFKYDTTLKLKELATKHNFIIFEDRKFADIGNTVMEQFGGGMYKISSWADLINAHPNPGPGIVKGLKETALRNQSSLSQGCLLIAQMSSEGNLANEQFTKATVKMAEDNKDFIIGYICQEKLSSDPGMLHMTPGVKLEKGGDGLGQQYLTPDIVIGEKDCDIIIVGRGIVKAQDSEKAAALYQDAGYKAYLKKIS